jgi:hypothetical protein
MLLLPAEINIKNHIIKSPDLFQCRSDVLHYVLLADPESSWHTDGTIHSHAISRDNVENPKLNTSGLPSFTGLSTPSQIHAQIEKAKYQVIEQHLDTIVSQSMPYEMGVKRLSFGQLNEYSLIFSVPDNVEASWLNAVREVIPTILIANKEAYCRNSNSDGLAESDWVYPFAFFNHSKLIEVQNRFMPKMTVSPAVAAKLANLKKLLG